eukprot:scaffold154109_cov26-Cyclotella_meneghiniana.AAC.1
MMRWHSSVNTLAMVSRIMVCKRVIVVTSSHDFYLLLQDVNRLACTCKSLSSDIQSLLSIFAHNKDAEKRAPHGKDEPHNGNITISTEAAAEQTVAPDSNTCEVNTCGSDTLHIDVGADNTNAQPKKLSPKMKRSNSNSPRPIIPGERVSKRVRSQMLTSEKETERQAK